MLTLTSVSTSHPRAFAAALLTGGQLQRSAYIGFLRLPAAELAAGRGLRLLLVRSGLAPAWAERYARALAEPDALAAALAWYRRTVLVLDSGEHRTTAGTTQGPSDAGRGPEVGSRPGERGRKLDRPPARSCCQ